MTVLNHRFRLAPAFLFIRSGGICVFGCCLTLVALLIWTPAARAQSLYVSSGNASVVNAYDAGTGQSVVGYTSPGGLSYPEGIAVTDGILYIANYSTNSVGEYNATTGAAIDTTFINGFTNPIGLALSNNVLYLSNYSGQLGAYNATTGAAISSFNPAGLAGSTAGLAVSGNILYVATSSQVSEYNATTGAVINASFISGLGSAYGLLLSGDDLYVATHGGRGSVLEYDATTGSQITGFTSPAGLDTPSGLAIIGNTLYIGNNNDGEVGEYNATTGAIINETWKTGVATPQFMAVAVPEPSTWALLFGCAGVLHLLQSALRPKRLLRALQNSPFGP